MTAIPRLLHAEQFTKPIGCSHAKRGDATFSAVPGRKKPDGETGHSKVWDTFYGGDARIRNSQSVLAICRGPADRDAKPRFPTNPLHPPRIVTGKQIGRAHG